MNTITVNGITFTGEMILNAVEQTTDFPKFGVKTKWNPHQLVTSQEYDFIRKKMWDNHSDLIKKKEIPVDSLRYSIWETNLGGWRFLYESDGCGNWHTAYFSF